MKKQGFTLVELMIALSLSAVLLAGIFFSFGQGIRNWRIIVKSASNLQIENLIAERITSDIRAASEISAGSSSEEVVLKNEIETIGYKLVDRKVRRKKGTSISYLTSEDEVRKLFFAYPAAGVVEVKLDDFAWKAAVR